jgi:hypothetical protein
MKYCPCCNQSVQESDRMCGYCHEYIGFPFPLEVGQLYLSDQGINYKDKAMNTPRYRTCIM